MTGILRLLLGQPSVDNIIRRASLSCYNRETVKSLKAFKPIRTYEKRIIVCGEMRCIEMDV